jgi:hypothetical protein
MHMLRYYAKNRWEYFVSLPSDSLFLMFLCLASGIVQLSQYILSEVVDNLVPLWISLPWATFLILGAGITMYGLLKRPPVGFAIEEPGRILLGAMSIAYSMAVVWATGPTLAAIFTLGFGLSCFHRILHMKFLERQINLVLREIANVLE